MLTMMLAARQTHQLMLLSLASMTTSVVMVLAHLIVPAHNSDVAGQAVVPALRGPNMLYCSALQYKITLLL